MNSSGTVLVLSGPDDATADAVIAELTRRVIRDGMELLCVQARNGAWAKADVTAEHGPRVVTQGGPRRIWEQVEQTAARVVPTRPTKR